MKTFVIIIIVEYKIIKGSYWLNYIMSWLDTLGDNIQQFRPLFFNAALTSWSKKKLRRKSGSLKDCGTWKNVKNSLPTSLLFWDLNGASN